MTCVGLVWKSWALFIRRGDEQRNALWSLESVDKLLSASEVRWISWTDDQLQDLESGRCRINSRHCEERSDEAICLSHWDCFACARNDSSHTERPAWRVNCSGEARSGKNEDAFIIRSRLLSARAVFQRSLTNEFLPFSYCELIFVLTSI